MVGLLAGLISGFLWGVNNLFLSLGYGYLSGENFPVGTTFFVMMGIPLACVALTDTAAAISMLFLHSARGLLLPIVRTFKTRSGLVICLAALLGGPVGQTSYILGISMAGAANALIISSLYPNCRVSAGRFLVKTADKRKDVARNIFIGGGQYSCRVSAGSRGKWYVSSGNFVCPRFGFVLGE